MKGDRYIERIGHRFESLLKFKYLGAIITKDNDIREEIKQGITDGNRCYWSLMKIFENLNIPRALKIRIYKRVLQPVVICGSE